MYCMSLTSPWSASILLMADLLRSYKADHILDIDFALSNQALSCSNIGSLFYLSKSSTGKARRGGMK